MDTKLLMLDALRKKYEAQIADAYASALVYLNSAVGIGEHPQFIDELDKLINKISSAEESIQTLNKYFTDK
jgi:flagellar biosynthesis chaperone FliJ|tara:strand:- start:919 stop:1131 length:213 start_codon:yes stop_codon:yes gene_type:complete